MARGSGRRITPICAPRGRHDHASASDHKRIPPEPLPPARVRLGAWSHGASRCQRAARGAPRGVAAWWPDACPWGAACCGAPAPASPPPRLGRRRRLAPGRPVLPRAPACVRPARTGRPHDVAQARCWRRGPGPCGARAHGLGRAAHAGLVGASVAPAAAPADVAHAEGGWARAARPLAAPEAPPTVQTAGGPATPGAGQALGPPIPVLLGWLQACLPIRARAPPTGGAGVAQGHTRGGGGVSRPEPTGVCPTSAALAALGHDRPPSGRAAAPSLGLVPHTRAVPYARGSPRRAAPQPEGGAAEAGCGAGLLACPLFSRHVRRGGEPRAGGGMAVARGSLVSSHGAHTRWASLSSRASQRHTRRRSWAGAWTGWWLDARCRARSTESVTTRKYQLTFRPSSCPLVNARRSIYHTLWRVKSGGGIVYLLSVAGLIACKDASLFDAFSCP